MDKYSVSEVAYIIDVAHIRARIQYNILAHSNRLMFDNELSNRVYKSFMQNLLDMGVENPKEFVNSYLKIQ